GPYSMVVEIPWLEGTARALLGALAMRVLSAHFAPASDFLGSYNPDFAGGALFYPTRMPLRQGEAVILEVRLPTVPLPVFLRSCVLHVEQNGSAWLGLSENDKKTREF